MNTLKALFSEVDFVTLIVWILGAVEAFNLVTKGIDTFCDKVGIESRVKRERKELDTTVKQLKETSKSLNDSVTAISDTVAELKVKDTEMDKSINTLSSTMNKSLVELTANINKVNGKLDNLEGATVEDLYDCINRKCKYYMYTIKGIPSDEFDSFKRLIEAYDKCGGNHGLQARVQWCLENLDIVEMGVVNKE